MSDSEKEIRERLNYAARHALAHHEMVGKYLSEFGDAPRGEVARVAQDAAASLGIILAHLKAVHSEGADG